MQTTMTAEKLTRLFLKKKIADHGIPEQIINDKNKLFTSKFNTKLRETLKIKKSISTAFHFQTNGQTERMNQTLEQFSNYSQKTTNINKLNYCQRHKWQLTNHIMKI